MGYRQAPGRLKGIELNERCQAHWALSHCVCSKMVQDLCSLEARSKNEVTTHILEGKHQMESDEVLRNKLQEKISNVIDPLDPSPHPNGQLLNIVTGKIAPEKANVDQAVELGQCVALDVH